MCKQATFKDGYELSNYLVIQQYMTVLDNHGEEFNYTICLALQRTFDFRQNKGLSISTEGQYLLPLKKPSLVF